MKKLSLLLLLPLAACATVPSTSPTPGIPAYCATQIIMDDKGMVALETLYNVPAHAYVTADKSNALPADAKAKLKPLLVSMYEKLKVARAAKTTADAISFSCAAATLETDNKTAVALLPKG